MNTSFNEKEKKIISVIEEITGITPTRNQEPDDNTKEKTTVPLFRIKRILILASSYNYFLLEEEGRLGTLFTERHLYEKNNVPPDITHVESWKECVERLDKENYDLLIIFNKPENIDVLTFSEEIKKISKVPIVVLGNNIAELSTIAENDQKKTIENFFTWNGDGKIILTIVQYVEDSHTIIEDPLLIEKRPCILLIEDSLQYYSTYLLLIYEEIWGYIDHIMKDDLTDEQRILRYKRRPFVVHAQNFEDGKKFYERYKNNLLCLITDNQESQEVKKRKQAGVELAINMRKEKPSLPILIQSSEPIKNNKSLDKDIVFISKNNPNLRMSLKEFLQHCLGPQELIFQDENKKEIYRVHTLREFEDAILSLQENILVAYAKNHAFSKWLRGQAENELAEKFHLIEAQCEDAGQLRKRMLDVLETYRYSFNQTAVTHFQSQNQETHIEMSRIGNGALGGKARGLVFLAKLISEYISDEMFPDLRITVPRTIVLSTEVFDDFINQNNLLTPDLYHLSDERIASRFMSASLPATILGDLRAFIRKTRKPLAIRSSGILEDSLLQSFAGIYESMLLPNESWEADFRFQEVCNAIKYVYASTYFEKARTYIKSTPKNIGDEKMAVVIQEVVGSKHENYFYPAISGVAKSYNYYPSGGCKQEDGIVYLALGLGKAIVDGGCSFCFCPERPNVPLFGTPKDFIKFSQRSFYVLNIKSVYRIVNTTEETFLSKLDIDAAKKHGILEKIASTYVMRDDTLYPGVSDEGSLVIDFGPIVSYDAFPLAKALKLLLKISEIALGYPVEIEFAVNFNEVDSSKAELVILQIRNMLPPGKIHEVTIEEYDPKKDICYSENALGNGIIDNISDIVYVKSSFEMANSARVVSEIRTMNSKLMEEGKPYLLVGPGRWGSADPWLGIPVIWSDIAGAKVIVETPFKERSIDPSQGSHFFHDLISSQVGYLITKEDKGNIDWLWLDSLPVAEETNEVRHIRIPYSVEIRIDGRSGKAVIRKKKSNK